MASFLFNYKYLTALDLASLDKYKYKSIDNSPLSVYVMHPFWNQIVKIYPLWLSANILTMAGWLFSLLIFLVLSYYDPYLTSSSDINTQTVPSWVWLLGAFCIFLAHQLDGTDGKQARRTNSGSALGELFDHGLDSSTVVFMTLGILSLFGLGEQTATPWEVLFILYVILAAFWITHWEKYNTSVLFLPWAYDVSQIWLAGSYLFTFIYGIQIWKEPIYGDLGFPIVFKSLLYFLVAVVCVPVSLYNQYSARKYQPSDCVSLVEGFMPVVALLSVTFLYTMFGYVSSSNIVESQLRLFLVGYGILYSNITCRLIVAQMMSGTCDRFNILAVPLLPMIVLSKYELMKDETLLSIYVGFLVLGHLHYGINVVRQICIHLNIHCFKLGKRTKEVEMNGPSHKNGRTNGKLCSNGTNTNGKISID